MKKLKGRPLASVTACNFVFMPPLVRPIRRPRPPFLPQGWKPGGRACIDCRTLGVAKVAPPMARPSEGERRVAQKLDAKVTIPASVVVADRWF